MRKLLLILLLPAMPSITAAQRMGPAHFPGHAAGFNRRAFSRAAYYPLPVFDPFDSGYVSDAPYPAPSQRVVFMMPAEPAPAVPEPAPPAQPLMIELQGDRYVQVSGDEPPPWQMIDRMAAVHPAIHSVAATAPPRPASALLVFRDGHRQEVSAYTIADGDLYAAVDYSSAGAWNQQIALSSLNLPETVAANQSRGVQFRLPAAPNEVIVGP